MKIDRLISIIMILNNEEKVTAKDLSERLEVSTKTIQRDIETISMAGILKIYLSDPRKTKPEKLKTIIRQECS